MRGKHDHSTRPNFRRVHSDRYEPYESGVPGCKKCQDAAAAKNSSLKMAATDNFLKKNRLA